MKISLIQHPLHDFYCTVGRLYPLGLCQLAAGLEGICQVEILDCRTSRKPVRLESHPYPELNDYYRPGLSGPLSLFSGYHRFGWSQEQIREALLESKPTVVGLSCPMTTYFQDCLDTILTVKEVNRDIVVIVGGLHATLFPEDFLEQDSVDFVIRGEGQTALRYCLEHIAGVRPLSDLAAFGVCYRRGREQIIRPMTVEMNINACPAHHLLDPEKYRQFRHKRYAFMMTSLGCPLTCKFCGKAHVPYRTRSRQSLIEELDLFVERQIRIVDLEDDMLNYDRSHFEMVLELLSHYPFEVYAMNGIFPINLDERTLQSMVRAGFRKVNLPIVSSTRTTITKQNRTHGLDFKSILEYLSELDLLCEVHFILGLPDQSISEIIDTIVFLMEHKCLLGPSIYYAVPGSTYWTGDKQPYAYCRSSVMFPHHLDRRTIITFMRLVRFVNFCKDLVDRHDRELSLNELYDSPHLFKTESDHYIVREFGRKEMMMAFERSTAQYIPEIQEAEQVRLFWQQARKHRLKGFKSSHTLFLD